MSEGAGAAQLLSTVLATQGASEGSLLAGPVLPPTGLSLRPLSQLLACRAGARPAIRNLGARHLARRHEPGLPHPAAERGGRFINAARPLANPWCRPGKEAASPYREPHSKSEEAAGRFVFRGQAHLSPQLAAKALGQSSKGRVPGGFLCARAWVTARTGGSEMPASLRPGRGLCRMPPEPGGLVRRGPGSTRPAHLAALPPPAPLRPGCV